MLKRFSIPALALLVALLVFTPAHANAKVHFGVYVGGPGYYLYPYYVTPYYSYGYPSYYYGTPYRYYPYTTYRYRYHGHDRHHHYRR